MPLSSHVPLQKATNCIIQGMKVLGFEISFEDDEKGFKDFFGTGDQLFEDSFCSLEFVLYDLGNKDGTGAGIEFHAVFYTQKGKGLQRSLSKNGFKRLKNFLQINIFLPGGLRVLEYDPPFRDYSRAKLNPQFFPDNTPGVEIHIGGWLGGMSQKEKRAFKELPIFRVQSKRNVPLSKEDLERVKQSMAENRLHPGHGRRARENEHKNVG